METVRQFKRGSNSRPNDYVSQNESTSSVSLLTEQTIHNLIVFNSAPGGLIVIY